MIRFLIKHNKNKYFIIKNIIDRLSATLLLIILIIIPIIPIVSLLIKLESRGSVFYTQERVGKDGKLFKMWKFRSMEIGSDEILKKNIKNGIINPLSFKNESISSYTKIGKFIRKTSIDELPQLINIIKGDMSIVGPRPIQKFEIKSYLDVTGLVGEQNIILRNSVLPGLLCYWQTSDEKDKINLSKRVDMDLDYVNNLSLATDFKIILKGIKTVLSAKNL